MDPMTFTCTIRAALETVTKLYEVSECSPPVELAEALNMLDPDPDLPPLLRIGPGGDYVKDYPAPSRPFPENVVRSDYDPPQEA